MKKGKIAILATYVGKVNRGAETFVIELVKKLRNDYDITVFSTGISDEISSNMKKVDIPESMIYRLHKKFYLKCKIYKKICDKVYFLIPDVIYQKKFSQKIFKKYIEQEKWDLIFPNNGIWGAKYAQKIRNRKHIPYIYTGHGGIGEGEKLILRTLPDKYVALTKKHYNWATKYCKNVSIIHNGVDCDEFKSKNINTSTSNKGYKLVLDIGELTEFKRHKLAISAVARLKNVKLLILGKGEMYNELYKYGRNKLGDRFEIKSVPYECIKGYYEMADIFTLPSLNEPFGIVYLEAMAMNLPVVAPNDESRREIIGKSGILCNCSNIEQYSESIKKALEVEWGDMPRKQALRFDLNIVANEYDQLIEELI